MKNPQFAIAAGSPETAAAGAQVGRAGGNAVDVAIASALAATVTEVLLASLGGSGFVMIRLPGQPPHLVDGADAIPTIPPNANPTDYDFRTARIPYGDGIDVQAGYASVAVPGVLAALHLASTRFGQLPWREVVHPALELSRRQLPTGRTMAEWLDMSGKVLFAHQDASRQCFLPNGNEPIARRGFVPCS